MPRYLADENFNDDVLNGLRARIPGVDIVTARQAGLRRSPDPDVLGWAATHDRVVLTHDRQTMIGFARARLKAGKPMPGLIVVAVGISPGLAIDDLELLHECTFEDEWSGNIRFVPA